MMDKGLITETILGQVVSKANNYQVGNNRHGSRYIIKSPEIRAYERSFSEQCKIYKGKGINGKFTLFIAWLRKDLIGAIQGLFSQFRNMSHVYCKQQFKTTNNHV